MLDTKNGNLQALLSQHHLLLPNRSSEHIQNNSKNLLEHFGLKPSNKWSAILLL